MNYSLKIFEPILKEKMKEVEVRAEAKAVYLRRLHVAFANKVWNGACRNRCYPSLSCSVCKSPSLEMHVSTKSIVVRDARGVELDNIPVVADIFLWSAFPIHLDWMYKVGAALFSFCYFSFFDLGGKAVLIYRDLYKGYNAPPLWHVKTAEARGHIRAGFVGHDHCGAKAQ